MGKTPLFVWHGVADDIIPFWSNLLYLQFQFAYYGTGNFEYHWKLGQGHELLDEETEEIQRFNAKYIQ